MLCAVLTVTVLYIAAAFFGNPISLLTAKYNTSRYLEEHFGDSHFQVNKVGYNFKTGGYYAHINSPSSQDSYFTLYFDGWGRYRYDTYENITNKNTTLSRLDNQYRELVEERFNETNTPYDISIVFGELKISDVYEIYTYTNEKGETIEYTLDKEYGFDRSQLELDKEYDIYQTGLDCGRICLYIHDPEVTVERAAEVLLEVKAYMDEKQVPFHALNFHLCEPRNELGQNVGDQITLFEFLYSDIHEEGLIDRVQEHWDIAREHYAIQDAETAKLIAEQSKNQENS